MIWLVPKQIYYITTILKRLGFYRKADVELEELHIISINLFVWIIWFAWLGLSVLRKMINCLLFSLISVLMPWVLLPICCPVHPSLFLLYYFSYFTKLYKIKNEVHQTRTMYKWEGIYMKNCVFSHYLESSQHTYICKYVHWIWEISQWAQHSKLIGVLEFLMRAWIWCWEILTNDFSGVKNVKNLKQSFSVPPFEANYEFRLDCRH